MKRIKDLIRFNTFGSNGVFDITVNYYTRAITKKKKKEVVYTSIKDFHKFHVIYRHFATQESI